MKYEIDVVAISRDITPARFPIGRCLATRVVDIGIIMDDPSPPRTLQTIKIAKLGAR